MTKLIADYIQNVPLFADVDRSELIPFLKDCEIKEFKAGEYLCRAGEYDEKCSIILVRVG